MNMIKEIGISICVTAVAAAIFQGLMPKSSLEKTARFVLSVFFISCLVVPFTHFDFSSLQDSLSAFQTDDSQMGENSLQGTVNQKLSKLTEQSVSQTMRATLRKNKIEPVEIEVETTIGEDNCIMINRVIVFVQQSDYDEAEMLAGQLTEGDETKIEFRVFN
jgi:hypothetical protein